MSVPIPPPPTQAISDRLMELNAKWVTMKAALEATPSLETLGAILSETANVVTAVNTLVQAFVDDAWEADTAVWGLEIKNSGTRNSCVVPELAVPGP